MTEKLLIEVRAQDNATAALKAVQSSLVQLGEVASKALEVPGGLGADPVARQTRERARGLTEIDTASTRASAGVARLGSAFTSQLGPAGRVIDVIGTEVIDLRGGLDELVSSAGLSSNALLGIGAASSAVAAIGVAVGAAVQETLELERATRQSVAASKEWQGQQQKATETVRDLAAATGIASEEIAKGLSAAIGSGGNQDETLLLLTAGADAARIGLGTVEQSVRRLDDTLDAFNLTALNAQDVLRITFEAAQIGESDVGQFAEALARTGVAAESLGIQLPEVAAELAAITKQGVSASEAGQFLTNVLTALQNPLDSRNVLIQGLGADISRAALEAKGLGGILREVFEAAEGRPDVLIQLAGSAKTVRAALASARDEGRTAAQAMAEFANGTDQVAKSIESVNDTSSRLGVTWERIKATGGPISDVALTQIDKALIALNLLLGIIPGVADTKADAPIVTFDVKAFEQSKLEIEDLVRSLDFDAAKAKAQELQDVLAGMLDVPNTPRDFDAIRFLESAIRRLGVTAKDAQGDLRAVAGLDFTSGSAVPTFAPPIPLSVDTTSLQDSVREALAQVPDAVIQARLEPIDGVPTIGPIDVTVAPESVQRALQVLTDAAKPRTVDFTPQQLAAIRQAQADVLKGTAAQVTAEDLLASLRIRSLDGFARQAAEGEEIVRQTERRIDFLERTLGAESAIVVALREQLGVLKEQTETKTGVAADRASADIQTKILALRAASIDKAGQLATVVGNVADADQRSIEAIELRALVARRAADREIADLRERNAGNVEALAAIEEYGRLLRQAADEEARLAGATRARAKTDRTDRTTDLVSGAGDDLRVGLDREFAAIERNRQAKIKSAEDGVRSGQLDADALARLLPLYDAIAERDKERALRGAQLRDAEDIAKLVLDASDAFAGQAQAIAALRSVERERYADSLRDEGLLTAEIEKRLALFDKISAKQQRAATIQFAQAPAVQIAFDQLDNDAFAAAQKQTDAIVQNLIAAKAPAEEIGRAIEEGMQRAVDAIADARTGMTALVEGWKAGWKDFLREVNDDAAFGAQAAGQLGGGFRDGLSGAFRGERKEGQSVGETFLYGQLENVQKQASDFAANKVTALLFGDGGANKVGTPEEQMLAATTTFAQAVDRFAAASDPAANFALGTDPTGLNIPTAQGYDPSGNAIGGFIGPQLPASDILDSPYTALPEGLDFTAAGEQFNATIGTGADRAAQAIVSGGDVFGAGLQGIIGGIGNALSGILNSVVGGISGSFAEGGIVQGDLKPYTPHRAQYGRIARQRTLIEVAERPGLEEAIIPLRGGAVPVTLSRKEPPNRGREDRDATTELVQAMRGTERQRERAADREGRRGSGSPNITVQGSTVTLSMSFQGGPSGDRGEDVLRAMPEIEKRLVNAIETMQNRRLVNAIRGAVS